MIKYILKKIYIGIIIILLYAPIVTLAILSFNDAKTRSKWAGFTLRWYHSLFSNHEVMNALYTTLSIALFSALLATLIGTAASIGMNSMHSRLRTFFMGVTNIPMLNADIVTGISLMLLFIGARITLGYHTVLLAHITFNIPFVILSVLPKLSQTNKHTYEAALDLGASPVYAFFKVVFPDIVPGIFSGFLLSFTMSLDDFVITHFTKGPGVDTLSTKIYSEVRKGIKPEIYALSTLMFTVILLLLFLVNLTPDHKTERPKELRTKKIRTQTRNTQKAGIFSSGRWALQSISPRKANFFRRQRRTTYIICSRILPILIIGIITVTGAIYVGEENYSSSRQVIVYNWGQYMNPEVISMFEAETGIHVVYEEFETNEIMYPKIQSQAIAYDVVCPSDYMVQRMIENDLLAPINFDNIPNKKYIGSVFWEQTRGFDPEQAYSVPYLWGTVGILYNKRLVHETVDSWHILWDPKYEDNILMQDSVRDAFAVALKLSGHSLNSTDLDELEEAKELLLKQKPLVQAYVIDQVRDKMIGNEAALGVIYSGEALYCQQENPNLGYVIPKEGSNLWIDSLVIPKNAKNKENAECFINFLCRPDIAKMNFDYVAYSIPNEEGRTLIEDERLRNSTIAFPDPDQLIHCETFQYLGTKYDRIYQDLWREIKSK